MKLKNYLGLFVFILIANLSLSFTTASASEGEAAATPTSHPSSSDSLEPIQIVLDITYKAEENKWSVSSVKVDEPARVAATSTTRPSNDVMPSSSFLRGVGYLRPLSSFASYEGSEKNTRDLRSSGGTTTQPSSEK